MAGLQAASAAQLGFSAALSFASSFQAAVESRASSARGAHGVSGVRSRLRLRLVREGGEGRRAVRVNSASGDRSGSDQGAAAAPPAAKKSSSLLCQSCDGNGAVACSQCHGAGLNTEDHFNGRFKAGQTCWLCRGKRQMLCGNCNGAGFMGGFMNTQDE